jgi:hypothetical protein
VAAFTVGVSVRFRASELNTRMEGVLVSPEVDVLGTVADGNAIITVLDVVVFEQHVSTTSRESWLT